jgi:N-acyl-D-aspartate/D-glutamate deacylase
LQIVSDFADFDNELEIYRAMVTESGRPLSLSLAQAKPGNSYRRILDFAATMSAEGFPIRTQVGARAVGLIMGLRCTLHPFLTNKVYRTLDALSHSDRLHALRNPETKADILSAHTTHAGRILDRFELMFELDEVPNYEPTADMSIAARAAQANRDPVEYVYDLLTHDDG